MNGWNGGPEGGDSVMDDWGDAYLTGNNATSAAAVTKNTDSRILPITVSDLATIEVDQDDRILLGNAHFSTVRVLGRVQQVEDTDGGQTIKYIIADLRHADALFSVVHYEGIVSTGEYRAPPFAVAARLSIVGKIRRFDGELCVVAFDVKPLTDMNVMDAFHLEAKLARLYYTKNVDDLVASGMTSSLDGCMLRASTDNGTSMFSPLNTAPNGREGKHMGAVAQPHPSSGRQNSATRGLTSRNKNVSAAGGASWRDENHNSSGPTNRTKPANPQQRGLVGQKAEIYNYLRKCGVSAVGEFIEDIREGVPGHMYSEHTFDSDLRDLAADGLIIQANDDEHYVVNR